MNNNDIEFFDNLQHETDDVMRMLHNKDANIHLMKRFNRLRFFVDDDIARSYDQYDFVKFCDDKTIEWLKFKDHKDDKKGTQYTCRINRNNNTFPRTDLTGEMFLVFELRPDMIMDNVDVLLDMLSNTDIKMELGGSRLFSVKLHILYFTMKYYGGDIFSVDCKQLRNDLEMDIEVQYEHILRSLLKKDDLKKLLIIPMSLDFLTGKFPLKTLLFHEVRVNIDIKKDLRDFCTRFTIVSEYFHITKWNDDRINLMSENTMQNGFYTAGTNDEKDESFEIVSLSTGLSGDGRIFRPNDPGPAELKLPELSGVYFSVVIEPIYEEIDKDMWHMISVQMPSILSAEICENYGRFDTGLNRWILYDMSKVDMRRSKSQHIYFFSMNPQVSMKDWMRINDVTNRDFIDTVLENYDGWEQKKVGMSFNRAAHSEYCDKIGVKRERMGRNVYGKVHINFEKPTIPIRVTTTSLMRNVMRYMSGMGGMWLVR